MILRAAAVAFAIAAFVGAAPSTTQDAHRPILLRVLDSTNSGAIWDAIEQPDSVTVYRIEVRSGAGSDTLTDVIPPLPFNVGDSIVVGLRLERVSVSEGRRQFFTFVPRTKRLATRPLPDDAYFYDVMISPNGRYVAYVAVGRSGNLPIVRDFRTGTVLAHGPGGGGCECDIDRNHARWVSADSFEIAVAHHLGAEGDWLLFAGRASLRRVHTSRLNAAPRWH